MFEAKLFDEFTDLRNFEFKFSEGGYDFMPHHVHIHQMNEDKTSGSGLSLPDVFDVSLTALAFLSFGIFILQVIMCISMVRKVIKQLLKESMITL